MTSEQAKPWQEQGSRAYMGAHQPERFIDQQVSPLFFRHTDGDPTSRECKSIISEEKFWQEAGNLVFGDVRLNAFRFTDWFPRAPGVYWSAHALHSRQEVWRGQSHNDAELGKYFSPISKMHLIEEGGIGTIRLRPRRIDGMDCWLATALKGSECHCGIPLAIPDMVLRKASVPWGDRVNIKGRVRFLQDAGLNDTAARVHHSRPVIVFVDELQGVTHRGSLNPIVITPVSLFELTEPRTRRNCNMGTIGYTFVNCAAGPDSELDAAVDWIEKYATRYRGRLITNFDEQRPILADAPLSYQRLIAKTYDRTIIERFAGTILVDRIDRVTQESATIQNFGDVHVGHKINVGGSAIINIDATLSNVVQTIESAPGLDLAQKSNLDSLVKSLKSDLDVLKASHADEIKEIAEALEKAVINATKPPQERKRALLQLSAKGLKDAAELVKDVAPDILTTAGLIGKFIVGL